VPGDAVAPDNDEDMRQSRHHQRYYDEVLPALNDRDRPTAQLTIRQLHVKRSRPVFVGKRHVHDDDDDDYNKRRGPVFVGKRPNPVFVG